MSIVHVEKAEFVVTGTGWGKGPFERKFESKDKAKAFARACVAAAKSKKYADTVRISPQ